MSVPVKIAILQTQPPDVSKRKWREFSRQAHLEQGEFWHRTMLANHFSRNAPSRYAYARRKPKYLANKLKAAARGKAVDGGTKPLVFTGVMREFLTRTASLRAFPSRVTITLTGPSYVTQRLKDASRPDLAKEVTAVAHDEVQRLSDVLEGGIVRRLIEYREPRETRIQ